MRARPYPRNKHSGVEWLGDVPEHWAQIPLRRTSTRYAGGTPDGNNDSYWDEGTIPWINSGSVNQGLITEPSDFITEEAYRNSSTRWVAKGALVMALAGQGKTKGMVAQTGIATTCNQSMAAICPAPPMEARYLYWLLVSQYEHIRNMAGGEARDGLNLEILGAIPCLKVPPAEQRTIASFLDRETGRIDALVSKKRALIERLKEKRTALISRTVTHGLPPAAARAVGFPENPPLKPSGLDWLGDIPMHWMAKTIRRVTGQITNGFVGPTRDILRDEGVRYIQSLHVKKQTIKFETPYFVEKEWSDIHARSILRTDDLVIVQTGGCTGEVAIIPAEFGGSNCHALIILKSGKCRGLNRYLLYVMASEYGRQCLESVQTGALHPHLNSTIICNIVVPSPPIPEQSAISEYLDSKTAKLDALVGKVEEAVERLQEYRTAIITAAVTGKIDVRKSSESKL